MGTYLNPGNSGFAEIIDSDYVDKTGLIRIINSTIGKKQKLTCIRPPFLIICDYHSTWYAIHINSNDILN